MRICELGLAIGLFCVLIRRGRYVIGFENAVNQVE